MFSPFVLVFKYILNLLAKHSLNFERVDCIQVDFEVSTMEVFVLQLGFFFFEIPSSCVFEFLIAQSPKIVSSLSESEFGLF